MACHVSTLFHEELFCVSMFTMIKSFDQSVFWFINSHHNGFFDYFFSLATTLGTGWVIAPILLFFIVKALPHAKRVSFILFSLIIMIASGIINSQFKHYFRTPRPAALFADRQKAPSNFTRAETQPPSVNTVHVVGQRLMQNSFPSGHSNTAFAAATLLALRLGGIFWQR